MKFAVLLTTAFAVSSFSAAGPDAAPPPASNCQGREQCQVACDSGQLDACLRWGDQLMDGIGGPAEPDTAIRVWDRACGRGLEAACRVSAIYRLGQDGESSSATRSLEASCGQGDAPACAFVAAQRPPPASLAELERNNREDCFKKKDRDGCRAVLCAEGRRVGVEQALGGFIVESHRREHGPDAGDLGFDDPYRMLYVSEGCRLGERAACAFNEQLLGELCKETGSAVPGDDASGDLETLKRTASEECRQGKLRACAIYDAIESNQ